MNKAQINNSIYLLRLKIKRIMDFIQVRNRSDDIFANLSLLRMCSYVSRRLQEKITAYNLEKLNKVELIEELNYLDTILSTDIRKNNINLFSFGGI